MKKYLIIGVLVLMPFLAKADSTVYGFLNGNFYDQSGELKYACLMDGSCYDYTAGTTTTLSLILGLSSSTPQTIVVSDGLPTPASAPVVANQTAAAPAAVSAPEDTTPPQFLGYQYWAFTGGTIFQCANYPVCPSADDRANMAQSYAGAADNYNLSIDTDEPTTAVFTFTSSGSSLTFTDDNLSTVHNVKYSDVSLVQGVSYDVQIELTDAAGNVTEVQSPDYNINLGWQ